MPTHQTFHLPDAGEGLTEAEIVEWHVAVGDTVELNQTIVEIETAKSLVELPSPYAGVVVDILVQPGTTVDVGAPIIVVDVDPSGAAAPAPVPADDAGAAVAGADAAAPEGKQALLVGYGVADASSARRPRVAQGAAGSTGGQRATAAAPAAPAAAPAAAAPASPAATSAPAASSAPAPAPASAQRPAPAAPTRTAPVAPAATAPNGATAARAAASERALAKPPVRKLARDLGIDLGSVNPTGPGGIVTREDVVAYQASAQPQALATYAGDDAPWLAQGTVSHDGRQTRVPVKSVRKRTAEAMVASAFTAPHVTVFHTVDVTRTMKLVARLREDREFTDVRVTPLLVAAKALILAVDRHPEINASWDDTAQEIVYKHYVNLGIAAATPRGLVVPNIKDAHRMGLKELAVGIAELTATARAGKTTPSDMSDGTITITNVGVFGIDTGTPILNPGEAAILAFGAIREQPWVHKGKIRVRHVTQLALSFDHRLVDGGLGARVLSDVAKVLEDPAQGLVWG
ncbi:dihydrolipoamide acetyltransferase family protein [Cellulomonas cellasea]|uniref:Dihydrolipoamide acetyltransferase component of pyruvate dehydrogenase complex n=1 Tax=Cellulomonas cellasea TaxID=43670 RepID=A0A7W4UFV2_9CELL|nr:dihydrolipoamide acetyltransferase family protein [Cellulomonas cellasea]MBB2923436.1 pyruvate dehydrogenase E2 component (dihydrolipoamide acetyltransferase) [Cellulomonas cellasea]